MSKSKHSSLPFEVKLNYDNMLSETIEGRHTIKDADGWNIARIWENGYNPKSTEDVCNPEANANFIVRACNSYDAMLAACKATKDALVGRNEEDMLQAQCICIAAIIQAEKEGGK